MATRRQPLSFGWLIPGAAAACLLVIVALAAFLALWLEAPQAPRQTILSDSYLWHVVRFSFWQAFFCRRCFSVVPAIFPARAPVSPPLSGAHAAAAPVRDDVDPAGSGGGVRHPQRLWPPGLARRAVPRARLAVGFLAIWLTGHPVGPCVL